MNKAEHLLATFAEECAETQQAIGKALRFGHKDGYPGASTKTHRTLKKNSLKRWLFAICSETWGF